jgi:hypothetical protein
MATAEPRTYEQLLLDKVVIHSNPPDMNSLSGFINNVNKSKRYGLLTEEQVEELIK